MRPDQAGADRSQAPDSCTLDAAGRRARAAEFGEFLTAAVLSAGRPDRAGIRLELRPDEHTGRVAGGLAAAETACCSFFTFTLTASAGRLVLEVTVPPGREDALDAILRAGALS